MRLADMIMNREIKIRKDLAENGGMNSFEITRDIRKRLLGATRFIFDNVSDYLFSVSDKEEWIVAKDFPNLAPPFEHLWVEMQAPKMIRSEGIVKVLDKVSEASFSQWGFLVHSIEEQGAKLGLKAQLATSSDALHREKAKLVDFCRWLLVANPIIVQQGNLIWPGGLLVVGVAPDGRPLFDHFSVVCPTTGLSDLSLVEELNLTLSAMAKPLWLGISFMHCAHAEVIDRKMPFALRHANAKKKKLTFKVLQIEAVNRLLKEESPVGTGVQQSLHICRGHFKDYRKSGLFGKVKGVFWWADHDRGNEENGIVVKEYAPMIDPVEERR